MGDVLTKRPTDGLCSKFVEDMHQYDNSMIMDASCDANSTECNFASNFGDDFSYTADSNIYTTKCKRDASSSWVCKTPTSKLN